MELTTLSFTPWVVLTVGSLIFWANPRRGVNQSVFGVSIAVAMWLAFSHLATTSNERGLFWLKWTYSSGGLIMLALWMVKESILLALRPMDLRWLRDNIVWFVGATCIAVVPFTEVFIPSHSSEADRLRGWGYYFYYAGLAVGYGYILFDAVKKVKSLTGVRRLELQVWLYGGCFFAALIYILVALSAITQDPVYRLLHPLAVLVFYVVTGYAISTHRIFDARQIILVGVEKCTLVFVVATVAYYGQRVFSSLLSEPISLVATTAVTLWFAFMLDAWLDRKFQFYPHGIVARQAAFAVAQRETKIESLEGAFSALLKGWGQTEKVVIIYGSEGTMASGGVAMHRDSVEFKTLRHLRWATPERLVRERSSPERSEVSAFLERHSLGVVVIEEGPSLSMLVGLGIGASRRPYTYPQVTQLMELASIIENSLERAHFSAKVQRTEQLATVGLVGASLAHEIRNPLVSIKTFVQLLPTHHQDPVFREKFFRLIGDEVGRIDQLTEQLLDLASPRSYSAILLELHTVLRSSLDLVAAKAADKKVRFLTEFRADPDTVFTDSAAAKQVMLNLCFNAIQAVEFREDGERWIKVATRKTAEGVEMAVSDSGVGIAPEMLQRLFQPFQTTKSTGFGLGLAICRDILANLHASISVDPPVPGQGATFRVTYPCQPLSS